MNQIQRIRFERFITMLDHIEEELPQTIIPGNGPLKEFNMSTYGCGTAACAIGTAAVHPWFNAQGLHANWSKSGNMLSISLDGFESFNEEAIGAEFFGIEYHEAEYLFLGADGRLDDLEEGPENLDHMTAADVARRAREVLARYPSEATS